MGAYRVCDQPTLLLPENPQRLPSADDMADSPWVIIPHILLRYTQAADSARIIYCISLLAGVDNSKRAACALHSIRAVAAPVRISMLSLVLDGGFVKHREPIHIAVSAAG